MNTKDRILDAAERLFAHKGIEATSLRNITAEAGVNLAAVNYHFQSKEALQIETINNAYLTFEERVKGSIEAGKLADLVVLPEDILTCPEKHIEQMAVSMTMVGGKVVYQR